MISEEAVSNSDLLFPIFFHTFVSHLSLKTRDVICQIDHQTLFRTSVRRSAHTASDHLLVKHHTGCRPSNYYSAYLWSIKTCCQHSIITNNLYLSITELFDEIAARCSTGLSTDKSSIVPLAAQKDSKGTCMFQRTPETQDRPVSWQLEQFL